MSPEELQAQGNAKRLIEQAHDELMKLEQSRARSMVATKLDEAALWLKEIR